MDRDVAKMTVRLDVGKVAPKGCRFVTADIFWGPVAVSEDPIVVFCFAGGGISRRYYDLDVPGYSMARHLAALGLVTVTVDHPGTGASDVPTDPWTLTPEVVADVDVAAVAGVLDRLASGGVDGLPAMTPALVIGLGHSAGGLVVLHQQSRRAPYAAIALLGWAGHGLPEYLDETGRRLADHPERLAAELVDAVRLRHGSPLVELPRGNIDFLVANRPPEAVHVALAEARTPLLAIVGYASMIPGSAAPCVSAIAVPVFVGIGDRDIARDPRRIPSDFTSSGDLTVFVIPGAGHNHNVEPSRTLLWDRLAAWAYSMRPLRPEVVGPARVVAAGPGG